MQFPETYKFTCVSTGHLRQSDVKAMEDFSGAVANYPEGFFIWTGYAPSQEVPPDVMKEIGPILGAILDAASAEGYAYVQFDSDGPELDGFPTFDW